MNVRMIFKAAIIKTFVVLMIIGILDSAAFSQTRIKFARGRTSTTINGSLTDYGSRDFILGASRGQVMTVRVTSNTGNVRVEIGGNDVGKGTTITLRSTDDYIITVINDGRAARYSLYISIR